MQMASGTKRQRGVRERMAGAVQRYASLGWPTVPGAHSLTDGTRACSCDRVGCPAPGAHPLSHAWQSQASVDVEKLAGLYAGLPDANIVLPTGRVFDVLDVPAAAGTMALARMTQVGAPVGPVAALGDDRCLFFVATRGAPMDEDEWWSCNLDCVPEMDVEMPGMRWHCRDSYVIAPPSVLPYGREVVWVKDPEGASLPDPLRLLEVLADFTA
jgi:Bifunctional DNA primase/polymerase, N-terminal